MEIRTIDGRRATDRAGAGELLGITPQTIALYASPKQRPTSGFPEPVGTQDRRDWYALDDLNTYAARREADAAAPRRAPAWLRDGDPDELLPAKTFRDAAGVKQGTWKRYVQDSVPHWKEHRDGYLPLPDNERPASRGTTYEWTRRRMIEWLDNRSGERAGAGRTGGDNQPTIADAVQALTDAGGDLSHTELAAALGVSHPMAQYLRRQARARLQAADPE